MLKSALAFLASLAGIAQIFARRGERAEAEETGAEKQRLADQEEGLDAREEQLREAADHRRGDAGRRLRRGDF